MAVIATAGAAQCFWYDFSDKDRLAIRSHHSGGSRAEATRDVSETYLYIAVPPKPPALGDSKHENRSEHESRAQ